MKFHVLTLFPEMISGGLNLSVIGKAVENNRIALHAVDIREYSLERHRKVDDYPYGGGAGMLMQAQPIYDAHRAVTEGRNVRTIYVTPQGIPFTQTMAEELSEEEELEQGVTDESVSEACVGGNCNGLCLHRRLCAYRRRTACHGHD